VSPTCAADLLLSSMVRLDVKPVAGACEVWGEFVRIINTTPAAKRSSPSGFLFMALKIHSPPPPNDGLDCMLM
jgi:hypothetical protein